MEPRHLFEYILKKYNRQSLPLPKNLYLSTVKKQPPEIQIKIAQNCSNPVIIEFLVTNPNRMVSDQAKRNEYWQLIGQFKKILRLPVDQKIKFIRREDFSNLLVFILFETNLQVLEELYNHPSISLYILNFYRGLLKRQRTEGNTEQVLRLVNQIIEKRKKRIFKITEVFSFAKFGSKNDTIGKIFQFLLDEDEIVVKSAVNILKQYHYNQIRAELFKENPFTELSPDSARIWNLLENLRKHFKITEISDIASADSSGKSPKKNKYEIFLDDLLRRKIMLLKYCSENLEVSQNVITIAMAHLDKNDRIQEVLKNILSVEEVLALAAEKTFPQYASQKILNIFKKYPSIPLRKRISELLLQMTDLNRRRYKEMEISVNAYFDIIFNSIGFPQIRDIHQAFRTVAASKKLTIGFLNTSDSENTDVFRLFGKIVEFYQAKLSEIYFDVSRERIKELHEIYHLIRIILDIPMQYLRQEALPELFEQMDIERNLGFARSIWKTAIGQYYGRLRELDEMIKKKWLHILVDKNEKILFMKEVQEVVTALENEHKEKNNCRIQINCSKCRKRTCASEKYLNQIEFFLGEFLNFIASDVEFEDKFEEEYSKQIEFSP